MRVVPTFQDRTAAAQEQVIRRFTKHIGLTQHVATHTAQKHYEETEDNAKDFITMMKERMANRNKDDILNMDQTSIDYSFHAKKTSEVKGSKNNPGTCINNRHNPCDC